MSNNPQVIEQPEFETPEKGDLPFEESQPETGVAIPVVVVPDPSKAAAPKKAKKSSGKSKGKKTKSEPIALPQPPPNVPIVVEGMALRIFEDAASTFVPALRKDMSPEERRTTVRDVAYRATQMDDRLNLVLGELLYEVAENGYHRQWENPETMKPFETFVEYVQTELNMQKSKAHYLKKIYKVFVVDLELDVDVLREIEWSKAKELTEVVTRDNATEYLEKTKTMSVPQVKQMVAQMKGKKTKGTSDTTSVSSRDESKVRMIFQFTPEQAEEVQAALKLAEGMTSKDSPAYNLSFICTDFMGGAAEGGLTGAMASLDRNVQALERAFGVTLEVKDHDSERYAKLKEQEEAREAAASK